MSGSSFKARRKSISEIHITQLLEPGPCGRSLPRLSWFPNWKCWLTHLYPSELRWECWELQAQNILKGRRDVIHVVGRSVWMEMDGCQEQLAWKVSVQTLLICNDLDCSSAAKFCWPLWAGIWVGLKSAGGRVRSYFLHLSLDSWGNRQDIFWKRPSGSRCHRQEAKTTSVWHKIQLRRGWLVPINYLPGCVND